MKRLSYLLIIIVTIGAIALCNPAKAQEPPHPPTIGHGNQGNQAPGGTAPIDGGLGILITFGLAYGYQKVRAARKAK